MATTVELNSVQLLTVNAVAQLLSVSVNHVWELNKNPAFPKPIKLSRQTTRWRLSDVRQYLDTLAAKETVN